MPRLKLLGDCRLHQKKYGAAEEAYRPVLAVYQRKAPQTVPYHEVASLLGAALAGQKKFAEAEPLALGGAEFLKARAATLSEADHGRMAAATQRLIDLYVAWGRAEEAVRWRQELAAAKKSHPRPPEPVAGAVFRICLALEGCASAFGGPPALPIPVRLSFFFGRVGQPEGTAPRSSSPRRSPERRSTSRASRAERWSAARSVAQAALLEAGATRATSRPIYFANRPHSAGCDHAGGGVTASTNPAPPPRSR